MLFMHCHTKNRREGDFLATLSENIDEVVS